MILSSYFSLFLFSGFVAAFLASKIPQQVHIALAGRDADGNHNRMAISWQTEELTSSSEVMYGVSSGVYTNTVTGYYSQYYETYHHHAVTEVLSPSTTFYYKVGNDVDGWSAEFKFVSAPLSSQKRNISFAVFGDLGVDNGEASINFLNKIKSDIDLIWHSGDISYADDSFLHAGCVASFCYEQVWDEYMQEVQPFASLLPYMTAPGNHEAECHDPACLTSEERRIKLANFTAYNTRFRMPSPESNSGALNMHFSFNYGPVHFISIDTETGYPGAAEETRYVLPCGGFEEQLSWLEADLQQANAERALRPWIFATGHHPMYQGNSINKEFQAAMEDLFYKYGVDIYFSGHVHSYERDYPVYKGEVDANGYNNPRATTHLLTGGAGNDEMRDAKYTKISRGDDKVIPTSDVVVEGQGKWRKSDANGSWTAVTDKDYFGIAQVHVVDDSTVVFEYYRTTTGEVFDSVTLKRDHSSLIKN